jgi:hypothetical protein
MALRRLLQTLLGGAAGPGERDELEKVEGPVLIVRSGPWPVLRALLERLATNPDARPVTVLCHQRDEPMLREVDRQLGLGMDALLYPRFGPFTTATLRGLIRGATYRTAFVLDGSLIGQGETLEHVLQAVSGGDVYVWNAGNVAWRQRPLRERLSREEYTLVRGLLRWAARHTTR